ncbi:LysR family transcriptional regulator [Tahibacter harae]|uniref:LysR family transcriptional regulator n=1 Tax=Tahibacter harae TaxID=2963937 RepID=A0ABT1QMB3_9GAMM|nr:LysR family transcriptional regulator [Tahibacter harae]MCQ4163648.1 LysR family transcriptional regulator [Tahibacter harae]
MSESLSDIAVFVACADSGRLSHAARALGITLAVASAALKRLEAQLGARLILRTTRSLRLSAEGERYLPHAREALAALGAGRLALAAGADGGGLVRITAPADFGRNRLAGWLDEFAALHPQVRFQITLDDAIADFYAAPVDLALRYGHPVDSSLIALPLAQLLRVACAAPDYIARRGLPLQPQELPAHDTVCYMRQQRPADRWRFVRGAEECEVQVAPRWTFNDAEMVRRWAVQGRGVAYRIWADVVQDVRAGRLQRVLPQWVGEAVPLNLVYTERRVSPALRALIDFLLARRGELEGCQPD